MLEALFARIFLDLRYRCAEIFFYYSLIPILFAAVVVTYYYVLTFNSHLVCTPFMGHAQSPGFTFGTMGIPSLGTSHRHMCCVVHNHVIHNTLINRVCSAFRDILATVSLFFVKDTNVYTHSPLSRRTYARSMHMCTCRHTHVDIHVSLVRTHECTQ